MTEASQLTTLKHLAAHGVVEPITDALFSTVLQNILLMQLWFQALVPFIEVSWVADKAFKALSWKEQKFHFQSYAKGSVHDKAWWPAKHEYSLMQGARRQGQRGKGVTKRTDWGSSWTSFSWHKTDREIHVALSHNVCTSSNTRNY